MLSLLLLISVTLPDSGGHRTDVTLVSFGLISVLLRLLI